MTRLVRAAAALSAAGLLAGLGGCAEEPTEVSVRSLEQSGRSAFVCLGAPGTDAKTGPGLPLTKCTAQQSSTAHDYAIDESGETKLPHIYALVTQPVRGEVAVVDVTTADDDYVIDQDPTVPGANFLPVGAQPVDIVATPGGTAAFVAVAELGRPGIFALPSTRLRPCAGCAAPAFTGWPACSLPAAPGSMVLVEDPEVPGSKKDEFIERASCDVAHGASVEPGPDELPGSNGSISDEAGGRQKLVVAIPDLGGFVVIDAQRLLDRVPGTFSECPVERWVPLKADVPAPISPPAIPDGPACVSPAPVTPAVAELATPRPAGLTYVDGRLYIADTGAPLIHVVDLPTPCEPVERLPLLPSSIEEPERVVTTTRVAVSPQVSSELKRYLYAIDAGDGSVMAFDVSDDQTERTPIRRAHPEWNPFLPLDRIRFIAPVRDMLIVNRDLPVSNPVTGATVEGIRCDPDPGLLVCTSTSTSCDPQTLYRTSLDLTSGAGPGRLRGTFAYLMLTSGEIVVVDIDDLDARCRVPTHFSPLLGCPPSGFDKPEKKDGLVSSGEVSCNVVVPHTTRNAVFLLSGEASISSEPGLQTYPLLHDKAGTLIAGADVERSPRMRATLPKDEAPPEDDDPMAEKDSTIAVAVAGVRESISKAGVIAREDGIRHALVMNLEDPRVHVVDQPWVVTYEGVIPGFSGKPAQLRMAEEEGGTAHVLTGAASSFCSAGVQSEASAREILEAEGVPPGELDATAQSLADIVQIVNDLPNDDDAHWQTTAGVTFQTCKTAFGTSTTPRPEREFRILEAYQDHVLLAPNPPPGPGQPSTDALVKKCFPTLTSFVVRARNQWVAVGSGSGFVHHVIADPATGACRNSCDPRFARMNGRVRSAPSDVVVRDGEPLGFMNPMFRFAITLAPGTDACSSAAQCPGTACVADRCDLPPQRDLQFRFTTQGSFEPLLYNLVKVSFTVQPQAMTFLAQTGEIAVTDGSLNGLIMVSAAGVNISRQFF